MKKLVKSIGKQTPVRRLTSSPPRAPGASRARARRENVRLPPAPRSPDPRGRSCLGRTRRPATGRPPRATLQSTLHPGAAARGRGARANLDPGQISKRRCQRGGTRELRGRISERQAATEQQRPTSTVRSEDDICNMILIFKNIGDERPYALREPQSNLRAPSACRRITVMSAACRT